MPNKVKVLVVGDIIGKGARNAFIAYLPTLKEKYGYDIISVNCENVTHGKGMNKKHYNLLSKLDIDVFTMGNHVLDNKEIYDYIDNTNNLVVPGNVTYENKVMENHKEVVIDYKGYKIKFINLLGSTMKLEEASLNYSLFYFDEIYQKDSESIYIIDYHAEYTMEKNLLGYYVDGRASIVFGTHTHVQTADERILPQGTAFISDVGMCGSVDSVIGYDYNSFVNSVKDRKPTTVSAKMPYMINAMLVEIDLDSKKAISVLRINEKM
ncbi:MAG: YmdB family metallophosphoesterase [Bacilli bacterium]|nr:YmdB family metallophosphoesterase [Bacilli bacterium]